MKNLVSSLSPGKIDNFKKLLSKNARILREGEQGYDEAIARWSDYAVKKAGMVVQVATLQDITETVTFARENNLDFAICGGGKHPSGISSSEGGIVLDMRKLCKVRVDPEQKLVYAQGGATCNHVNQETDKHGLACISPGIDSIGVGGFMTGGGFGYLTGQYGFSADNLVSATIVLADGSVEQLSATSNPDLFWAVRGCGFNFGIIYEFVIQAYEHPDNVYVGMLTFPGEKCEEVSEVVKQLSINIKADELVELIFRRLPPEHNPMVIVVLFLDSPSSEEFRSRYSALYSLQPIQDDTRAMSYFESNNLYNNIFGHGGRNLGLSTHLQQPFTISSVKNAWQTLLDFTDPTKELGKIFVESSIQFYYWSHDKLNKTKTNELLYPFPSRDIKLYNVYVGVKWPDEKYDKEAIKWLNETRESFFNDPKKDRMTFSNSCHPAEGDMEKILEPEIVYGKENSVKLKELKRKYDPNCFFNKWIPIKI